MNRQTVIAFLLHVFQGPRSRSLFVAITLLIASMYNPISLAATIQFTITDDADEGFLDPTPANPIGGNQGTSLGEQRQIALAYANAFIGTIINSAIEIQVDASFDPLTCNSSTALLGLAGQSTTHQNFSNAPLANTSYVQALANSLANVDLLPLVNDITASFNSSVDNNNSCLNNRNWYYGLDGNAGQDIDFLTTVVHELLHGLGFTSLVNPLTGGKFLGMNDAFMVHLEDHSTAERWGMPQMNDAERALSAADDPDLHWTGGNVQAAIGQLSAGVNQGHVQMHAPATVSLGSSVSHFSTAASPDQIMEPTFTSAISGIGLAAQVLQDIGWSLPASNTPISNMIANASIQKNTQLIVDIAVMDNDTAASSLLLSGNSSNLLLVDAADIVFSGTDRLRQLTITPLNNAIGSSTIGIDLSDGSNVHSLSFDLNVVNDLPPALSIDSPANGSLHISAPQSFEATAVDINDGDISALINWTSSIDGSLGTAAAPDFSLSDGNHTITASITDSGGNQTLEQITVEVSLHGDEDGDGLSNSIEVSVGTDPFDSDSDDDYVSDFDELNRDGNPADYTPGVDTDPNNPDTDMDGILDGLDSDPLTFSVEEDIPTLPAWASIGLAALLLFSVWMRQLKLRIR